MKYSRWFCAIAAAAWLFSAGPALAQDHGDHDHGDDNGHGHGHDKHGDDGDHYYSDHDRDLHEWYDAHDHEGHLPPGLAKKDQLPPGLEKQLVERGTLPPGLQKRIQPCPEDLARRLPPPPPGYENVLIGGHVVLLNPRTFYVQTVFHFEVQ